MASLQLPLPPSMTRIVGIHQSDIIIRTALKLALDDMRANPWLLDYVFASLPQDNVTSRDYGEKSVKAAKDWFLKTDFPIAVVPKQDEGKLPVITVELLESGEDAATLGDVDAFPVEDNGSSWPDLTRAFTPVSYTPATGTVILKDVPDCGLWTGMSIIDFNGTPHEIIEVLTEKAFKIDPYTIADLRDCKLKGHAPAWKTSVESVVFKESYRIGLHVQNEPVYLLWLHSIVMFALLRYKQVLLEGRGFERSTLSSSQLARAEWLEAENVFSRYITISGYVRQYWPKTVARVIDGVSTQTAVSGFAVSGLGAGGDVKVAGSGVNPDDQLWVGNLDSLRKIR